MTRARSKASFLVAMALAVVTMVACGPGLIGQPTGSGTASQVTAGPSAAGSAAARQGIGVPLAAVEATIDRELGQGKIVWKPRAVSAGKPPVVEGRPVDLLSRVAVIISGPPDDVTFIQLQGAPAATAEEARLSLAVIRATVPTAEDWMRSSLEQPPARAFKSFDGVNVIWSRSVFVDDGQWSMLYITSEPLPALPGGATYPPSQP